MFAILVAILIIAGAGMGWLLLASPKNEEERKLEDEGQIEFLNSLNQKNKKRGRRWKPTQSQMGGN